MLKLTIAILYNQRNCSVASYFEMRSLAITQLNFLSNCIISTVAIGNGNNEASEPLSRITTSLSISSPAVTILTEASEELVSIGTPIGIVKVLRTVEAVVEEG